MASFNKVHVKKLFMPNAHGTKKGHGSTMGQVTATADELNALDGITSTVAELNIMDGVTSSAAELNIMTGVTATAAELNYLAGALALNTVTATVAELNQLDASVNGVLMAPGAGIVSGNAIVKYGIINSGGIVTTQIMIDLTGLNGCGSADDIIGDDGQVDDCHIGRITTAINGVIWGGEIRCLETPAGGNVDINLNSASVDTGVQDAGVAALTDYLELVDCGNHAAAAAPIELTALPPANHYLYLSCGTATDADFSAGRLLITLWGYAA